MGAPAEDQLPAHLLPDREIHVVISVLSGHLKAQTYYDETLQPLLDSHNVKYRTHTTDSVHTIVNLARNLFFVNATKGVKQTIILLSGDGGITDLVDTFTGILNRRNDDLRAPSIFLKPVVVLIPMGTANALAWSSGVARDPLGSMLKGNPRSLPSFQVRFSPGAGLVTNEGRDREALTDSDDEESTVYGAVVFSWGLHASLVALSDNAEYRKHGLERFGMAAAQLLADPHYYRGKVQWQKAGEGWKTLPGPELAYILATMVSNLEEHFQISPATQPVDGTLRLVSIGPEPVSEIARLLKMAYPSGGHVSDPKVIYEEIDGLRIEFDEDDEKWRMVCIDGKIVVIAKGGWVEVTKIPGTGVDARRVVEVVC